MRAKGNLAREAARTFERLHREALADPNVVGFFLTGSRGKGRATKNSDFDIYLIVRDAVIESYRRKYRRQWFAWIEFAVMSLSEFRRYAAFDGPQAWDRYDFAHVKALLDRNGQIQRLIDEKGRIPPSCVRALVTGRLDAYANAVYRSFKCWQDRDPVPARLEAADSIPAVLDAIFAMDGGRARPFYKYLRWELETFPFKGLPITPRRLEAVILRILTTGDPESQRKLYVAAGRTARRAGYPKVFDSWAEHRMAAGVHGFERHDR